MTEAEIRAYLRNVVFVAKADEVVDITENLLLQDVCRALGGGRELLTELLGEDRDTLAVDLRPLRRYSDRVRCIEDMLELALVDGDVALSEKKVLLVAAQQAGIAREVVQLLADEARTRRAERNLEP